jgi:hypothetical protein
MCNYRQGGKILTPFECVSIWGVCNDMGSVGSVGGGLNNYTFGYKRGISVIIWGDDNDV